MTPEKLVAACCGTGNPAAWEEFVRRFHKLIAGVSIRVARNWGEVSRDAVDDLIQEVYLKLCADGLAKLRDFTPDHTDAMYAYIKTLAANLAHDHFKARESLKRGGGKTIMSLESAECCEGARSATEDCDLIHRKVLIGQIDACLNAAELGPKASRDREIFWLYYRLGLTAGQISELPRIGLSTKGVETTIQRLTRMIRVKLLQRQPVYGTNEGMLSAESL